jgi:hypothetical protein
MTTETISIITAANSSAESLILAGVIGSLKEVGTFQADPALRNIYMFSLLAAKPLPGLQTVNVRIASEHANAFRATVLAALGRRWSKAYERVTGHHELAGAEEVVVRNAVAAAVAAMAHPPYAVSIEKPFKYVQGSYVDAVDMIDNDQFEDDGITPRVDQGEPAHYVISTRDIQRVAESKPWTETSSEPLVVNAAGIDAPTTTQASDREARSNGTGTNYASGLITLRTVVYGSSPEARSAVLAAIASLPGELGNEILGSDTLLTNVQWHTPTDAMNMVRDRLRAGDEVSVQEMALLSPFEGHRERVIWAEGMLAGRASAAAQAQADQDDSVNPDDAIQAAAPRM